MSSGLSDGDNEDPHELREQFIHKFQNISRIMDCVGCEKCKLWGKLEVLGIGTVSVKLYLLTYYHVYDTMREICIALKCNLILPSFLFSQVN